jgi:hypothetical protein
MTLPMATQPTTLRAMTIKRLHETDERQSDDCLVEQVIPRTEIGDAANATFFII